MRHSNMQFSASKLKSLGLVETDKLNDIISSTACDIHYKTCMYGECDLCAEKQIQQDGNSTEIVTWHEWKNLDHEYGEAGNVKKRQKLREKEL